MSRTTPVAAASLVTMADDGALSVAAFIGGGLSATPLQKLPLQKKMVPLLPGSLGSLTFLHPSQVTAQEGGH